MRDAWWCRRGDCHIMLWGVAVNLGAALYEISIHKSMLSGTVHGQLHSLGDFVIQHGVFIWCRRGVIV